MYVARYIAVDSLQKKRINIINICVLVKYCFLTLFDTCCGGTEIAQFQLSFLGLEEPGSYHR